MKIVGVLIFFTVLAIILYYRHARKIVATVKKDNFDDNLFIQENNGWYNIDYTDLAHYNNQNDNRIDEYVLDMVMPVVIVDTEPVTRGATQIPDALIRDINGGSQNVHDTFVQEAIKKEQKSLPVVPYDEDSSINEIKTVFNDENINKVLKRILSRNSFISNISKNEKNVIVDTWEKVKHDENLKAEFKNQLLDCVDSKGNLFCGTGTVTRLTSSLYINDLDKMPKTKEMVNKEVLDKFAMLYTGENDRYLVKEQILKEYSDPSMKAKVNDLIDSWIEHV